MNDLISVYVPTRNRRALLARAIESVLRQDYARIELIVVNDCSTDDTQAWLDELASREPRLVVAHQPVSRGAPAARNRAIALATGTFITGLDDDDEFLPQRLSRFVAEWDAAARSADPPSCLFTPSLMNDGEHTTVNRVDEKRVSYLDLFRHNVVGNQVFCPTERIRAVGGFDEAMPAWQDLDLYIRLLQRYGAALRVDEASYVCYIDPGRDRISGNHGNRRAAFQRISAKYPQVPVARHQQLFLQMFSPFYGLMPSLRDFGYLVSPRFAPRLMFRLAKWAMKNGFLRLSARF